MGLWAEIEKLINEHGSAAILRDKVGLLELQRGTAEGQRHTLATQLAQAKAKIEVLEAEKAQLQAERDEAQQEIRRLGKAQSAPSELDDIEQRILLLIANDTTDDLTEDDIIRELGLSQAKGRLHFHRLSDCKFALPTHSGTSGGWCYSATRAGTEYLAKAGLV